MGTHMRHLFLLFVCFFFGGAAAAQITLRPAIGLAGLPDDDARICATTTVKNEFNTVGFAKGEPVADFTLYTINGTPVNLRSELEKKRPVLLVAGSYTCPVYRNQMPQLNALYDKYKDQVSIYIVYTIEAHPVTDPSPYSGREWVTSENQQAGILYRQPTTYGARKKIIEDMLRRSVIRPPVLVDGPCNEWWKNFGLSLIHI